LAPIASPRLLSALGIEDALAARYYSETEGKNQDIFLNLCKNFSRLKRGRRREVEPH
jgi:hypothetical protein